MTWEEITPFREAFAKMTQVFESEASDKLKYELIFSLYNSQSLRIVWSDPDMDYVDDYTALYNAAKERNDDLDKIFLPRVTP